MKYLLANLAELAERRAKSVREEAQMWDILARDLKRAYKEQETAGLPKPVRPNAVSLKEVPVLEDRLYVRVKEAQKIMGMGHGSIYREIGEGRLPIKKCGRMTLIAVADIHAWFEALPDAKTGQPDNLHYGNFFEVKNKYPQIQIHRPLP